MIKKFFVLVVCLVLGSTSWAVTLTGGVSYTVESARKEAFANVQFSIDKSIIKKNLNDPNFGANKKAIARGDKVLPDRFLARFACGGYGIVYKKDLYTEYYYNGDGSLDHLEKREKLTFPMKTAKYDLNGKLIRVVLSISVNDSYIFFPDGQLDTHWLNNKEYDLNGNVVNESY